MSIYLKKVCEEDCQLLFHWANDEQVRKNSFNNKEISYEEHIKWFNKKLKSTTCYMFILYDEKIPVGQVRIDIEDTTAIIGYSISSDFRGKGYASKMLEMLETEVKKNLLYIKKLIANVKFDNIFSRKIFKKLRYTEILKGDYIEYYKEIA
ncbi:GNAT family N-acetyltransferase [Clostridium ganghwense]|uniref:GNAT family N-acetyltransferase n=1 Tax=Clostridium ganghwense TaxID=312089 RepID=A0ABT4CQP6_9CLOT|nr:GNAT family N-acetyltransferase [Clostridium ganghwense]MCY6370411.1 GNAT family N-acetyltransferase [Clostridium ganghwense]